MYLTATEKFKPKKVSEKMRKTLLPWLVSALLGTMVVAGPAMAIPVTLDLTTDSWGEETSFEMILGSGVDAVSVAFDNMPGRFGGFVETGDLGDNATYQFEWDLDIGDYAFTIYDAYGDGIHYPWIGNVLGRLTLTTPDQVFVSSEDNNPFTGSEMTFAFSIAGDSVAPAPVPEPATILLIGTGLVGLAGASRKKAPGRR